MRLGGYDRHMPIADLLAASHDGLQGWVINWPTIMTPKVASASLTRRGSSEVVHVRVLARRLACHCHP